jgi:hypothetical protein
MVDALPNLIAEAVRDYLAESVNLAAISEDTHRTPPLHRASCRQLGGRVE